MQITNYWKKFADTGRVEDYLSYVHHNQSAAYDKSHGKKEPEEAGDKPYAGIRMGDRNDTETSAYWRI